MTVLVTQTDYRLSHDANVDPCGHTFEAMNVDTDDPMDLSPEATTEMTYKTKPQTEEHHVPTKNNGTAVNANPPVQETDGASHSNLFPRYSHALHSTDNSIGTTLYRMADKIPTVFDSYGKNAREQFVKTQVNDRVRAMLNNPFGKPRCKFGFKSQATICHVLLPLWKSGMLHEDQHSWDKLARAMGPTFTTFQNLLHDYGSVDFNDLRGYQPDWESESLVNQHRIAMASAALIHFDGDIAATIRWIGGPHTSALRDVPDTLAYAKDKIPQELYSEYERVLRYGIPKTCNAESSAENFRAYLRYGNHKSASADPAKAYQAVLKDNKRGFTLLFDKRLVRFLLNCHLTPQGMTDLDDLFKSPRILFDSTFRPEIWCMAINDWTHKDDEYTVPSELAEIQLMIWMFNLRITYPSKELYLVDVDVSGAFRWLKYDPEVVGMHTSIQCGIGVFNTGGTFGDCTTPGNWYIFADVRKELAKWLWLHQQDIIQLADEYLPELTIDPEPSEETVASFAPAEPDSVNVGVLNPDGTRKSPQFDHHVDDCVFCDTGELIIRATAASVYSLYKTITFPQPEVLNPLSLPKLDTTFNNLRKCLGRMYDTRNLTVFMCDYKRKQFLVHIDNWLAMTSLTLREVCTIVGMLEHHTRYAKWARAWFYTIQNCLRLKYQAVYYAVKRRNDRQPAEERQRKYEKILPKPLWKRIKGILSREEATLLWNSHATVIPDDAFCQALLNIKHYLLDTERPFEAYIGFIIPRDPHCVSWGDASTEGGGAGGYSPTLRFWYDIQYSPTTIEAARKKGKEAGKILSIAWNSASSSSPMLPQSNDFGTSAAMSTKTLLGRYTPMAYRTNPSMRTGVITQVATNGGIK